MADYKKEYIVIRLPLHAADGFSHTGPFDKKEYARQHKLTLTSDPVVQYDNGEIVLIFTGYSYEDNTSAYAVAEF
ncbi:MAG TPA: hypothetical protein VEZ17_06330 [Chitinophagaceae bacterium]|jgi:hypothetical protein|nr:hypothetical protein [Chitinophagaceae bacterium]